jgi:hypothetical protein
VLRERRGGEIDGRQRREEGAVSLCCRSRVRGWEALRFVDDWTHWTAYRSTRRRRAANCRWEEILCPHVRRPSRSRSSWFKQNSQARGQTPVFCCFSFPPCWSGPLKTERYQNLRGPLSSRPLFRGGTRPRGPRRSPLPRQARGDRGVDLQTGSIVLMELMAASN